MFEGQPITDAEVVSEGPKPPPPPPRKAELKPAAAAQSFDVFDGPVNDAPNARKKPAGDAQQARQAAKSRATGKKPGADPKRAAAPPVDPEAQRRAAVQEALYLLKIFETIQVRGVQARYGELLDEKSLRELLELLKYQPDEKQMICEPLADGFIETGMRLPWWARFGVAMAVTTLARQQLLQGIELKYQEHKRQAEAEAKPKTT